MIVGDAIDMQGEQELLTLHVDGVADDHGSVDRPAGVRLPDVPDLDVLIPTAGTDEVRVLGVELGAEDFRGVAWVTTLAALECADQATSLLIIDADDRVGATSTEHGAIDVVVARVEFVQLVEDGMKKLARGRVPVLQSAIRVNT